MQKLSLTMSTKCENVIHKWLMYNCLARYIKASLNEDTLYNETSSDH